MKFASLLRGAVLCLVSFRAPAFAQAAPSVSTRPPESAGVPEAEAFSEEELKPIEGLAIEDLLNLPVVTASRRSEGRALAAANVVSISRDDIRRRGWRSLGEVLAATPGLYVVDDLVQPSVGVRGVTGGLGGGTRIVRVMINGVPVNFRPDLSAFLGPEFIPAEAIERVEIAKGPLSALHGANAFLATVNVITRTPEEGVHGEVAVRALPVHGNLGYGASGAVTLGAGETHVLAAVTTEHVDRSGLRISKTFPEQRENNPRYAPLFASESQNDTSNPLGAYVQVQTGSEGLGRFTLEGGYQQLDASGEFRLNSALTHQSRVSLQNLWSNLRYEKELSEQVSLVASLGVARGDSRDGYSLQLTNNPSSSFHPNVGYGSLYGALEALYAPTDWLNLRFGVDGEVSNQDVFFYTQTFNVPVGELQVGDTLDLIPSGEPRQQRVSDFGAFVQATAQPIAALPNLHLTGNVRADTILFGPARFPLQLSWRGAVAYRWNEDLVTKLVAGRAFQTPSGQLMFAYGGFGTENNVIGNQTYGGAALRPQTATSVEAIVSYNLLKVAALEAGLFAQQIADRIEFTRAGPDFTATNRGISDSVGLEGTARLALGRFSPFAQVSLLQVLDATTALGAPTAQFPFVYGLVGTNVDVPELYLRASTEVRFAGARGATQSNRFLNNSREYTLPAYATWDLTVSSADLRLFGPGTETRLSATARNLLDTRYSEPGYGGFDVPTLGRTFFIELRQSL